MKISMSNDYVIYYLGETVSAKYDGQIISGEIIAVSNDRTLVALMSIGDNFGDILYSDRIAESWARSKHYYIDNPKYYGKEYTWLHFSEIQKVLNIIEEDRGGLQYL